MDAAKLQQTLEQTQQALATARQKSNRALTWHNLSQAAAKAMLLLAFCLWFRAQWFYIGPQWIGDLEGILAFILDLAMVAGLAFACATVPPIFWSSLVPSTPANTLLSRLYARYSLPGYLFVCAGAIVFTLFSFDVLGSYYLARPLVAGGGEWEIKKHALIALFLMIGFPAWALNKMTPEQWIDAVVQTREVARIQRAIELEEAVFRAMHARAIALFQADVTYMTVDQLQARNAEVATILATFARAEQRALQNVAETFNSLYGMELAVPSIPDPAITEKFRDVARALAQGAQAHDGAAHYGEQRMLELRPDEVVVRPRAAAAPVAVERERSPVPHSAAESSDRPNDHDRPDDRAERAAANRGGPPDGRPDDRAGERSALLAARDRLPAVWQRRDVERECGVEKTAATDLINRAIASGEVIALQKPKFHYRFVEEG